MGIEVQATNVFYKNQACKAPIVCNRGGARSSKSYSLTQLLSSKFLQEKEKKILIVRKTLPSLKLSTLKVFKEVWQDWGAYSQTGQSHIREEKMTLDYYYGTNWLHFGSVDDPEKIKSTDWNYVMMEEATEFKHDDFVQIRLRMSAPSIDGNPNQIFMPFNPVGAFHWIKTEVIDKMKGVADIHSSFLDNPFLSQEYIDILMELKDIDPNKWAIYGEGKWGQLDGLIYSNWEMVNSIPDAIDETFYGLDFGFNHPTALVRIDMVDGIPYETELLYQSGLITADIARRAKKLIKDDSDIVYCDAAEPDRIEELQRNGINAVPANKGPNSVIDGIDFVKTLKCKIYKGNDEVTSENLLKEIRSYSWKKDKDGNPMDAPVKFNDDLMDARRYAYWTHLGKRSDFQIRWL